jgi:hypothetical protein
MNVTHYLGFDPGGLFAGTGVALFSIRDKAPYCITDCVESVDDAIKWSIERLAGEAPKAAGLDTFLFWETGKGGWRGADLWLRKQYPVVKSSVLSSNSAHGSMSIQGMSLAIQLRGRWPQVELIETHPKVLWYALTMQKYDWPSDMAEWLLNEMDCLTAEIANDHCWDAALSAWAAFKGHTKCWKRDLRELSRSPIEPAGRSAFWWPE